MQLARHPDQLALAVVAEVGCHSPQGGSRAAVAVLLSLIPLSSEGLDGCLELGPQRYTLHVGLSLLHIFITLEIKYSSTKNSIRTCQG